MVGYDLSALLVACLTYARTPPRWPTFRLAIGPWFTVVNLDHQ